jgi:hypothetical protein
LLGSQDHLPEFGLIFSIYILYDKFQLQTQVALFLIIRTVRTAVLPTRSLLQSVEALVLITIFAHKDDSIPCIIREDLVDRKLDVEKIRQLLFHRDILVVVDYILQFEHLCGVDFLIFINFDVAQKDLFLICEGLVEEFGVKNVVERRGGEVFGYGGLENLPVLRFLRQVGDLETRVTPLNHSELACRGAKRY